VKAGKYVGQKAHTTIPLRQSERRVEHLGEHPRTMTVIWAKRDIAVAVYREAEKHKLIDIETLQWVTETGVLKCARRVERYGDSEYPADWPPATRRRS
jgi:hypothetical protein